MHAISVRRLVRARSPAETGPALRTERQTGAARSGPPARSRVSAERERQVELGEQAAQHELDPGLAVEPEPPHVRTPEADRVGAERERLEDVGAGADAAVEQHGELVAHRLAHARQRVERADRAVDLATAVVGDDQPVDAGVEREPRVLGVEDALEHDRQLGLLAQPCKVGPGDARVGELVGPVADRGTGVLLGRLLERSAEHGIAEVVGHALAFQERQIRVAQIARAPAEQPRVERDHDRLVAGVARTRHEARRQIPIPRPVQLIPAAGRAHRLGDVLDRMRGGRAEDRREAVRGRRARHRQLAFGMHDRLHAHGREQHGRGHRGAEHGRAEIPDGDVAQHPRHDLPALERAQVGGHRQLGAGAAGDVAEGLGGQALARSRFELARRHGQLRLPAAEAVCVDLVLEVGERLLQLRRLDVGHARNATLVSPARARRRPAAWRRRRR